MCYLATLSKEHLVLLSIVLYHCAHIFLVSGVMVLYGMTMGGMTSMLSNIDVRRSKFVHSYQAFKREVVGIMLRILSYVDQCMQATSLFSNMLKTLLLLIFFKMLFEKLLIVHEMI